MSKLPILYPSSSYFRHIFRTRDWARIAVMAAFMLIAMGVAVGAYFGFLRGFRFFLSDAYFGEALTAYTLEGTFFIVWILAFAGAAVSGISVLFISRENQFYLTTPVSPHRLFGERMLMNALVSLWPVVLIGAPAILAYAMVYPLHLMSLAAFFLVITVSLASALMLAALVDFALVRFFPRMGTKGKLAFVGAFIIGGVAVMGRILLPSDINQLFRPESFETAKAASDRVAGHFAFTPAHAALQFLYTDYGSISLSSVVITGAVAMILSVLLLMTVQRSYVAVASRALEGMFSGGAGEDASTSRGFTRFPLIANGGAFFALLQKDVMVFLRSGRETSRAFFLLFMLALYLFLFRRLARHGLTFSEEATSRIILFNVAVIGYFVTTLSLRFLYPMLSLEGRSAWSVFASPLKRTRIVWEKLVVGALPMLGVVILLAMGSAAVLRISGGGLAMFLAIIATVSATLSVAIGAAGALWPNFRDKDPDQLTTTMPGLAATVASFVYVGMAAYLGFRAMRVVMVSPSDSLSPMSFLLLISAGLLVAILIAVRRSVRRMDIVS